MENLYSLCGISAGVLSFCAYVLYIATSVWGKTRPNRATWFILTIVGILIASSYYAGGARETIWIALAYIAGPLIVFLIALRHGEGGWTPFDRTCLLITGVSLIFWIVLDQALLTLLINIGV